MKKGFYVGLGIIIVLILSLLGYGFYLNQRSENQITERMNERRLPLHGAKVTTRSIYPVFKMDLLNFYSNEMVDATALVNGRINKFFVERNGIVRAGDPLVELFNEEVALQLRQADSDILQAEAALTRAQNTYNRYAQLVEMDAISKQNFDEAKAEFDSAKARLENYRAKREQISIQQSRQIVTSPINGEVLRFYRQVGSYVLAGNPLALIGNFDTLHFEFEIADNSILQIALGQNFELAFPNAESFSKTYGAHYSVGNRGKQQTFPTKLIEISPSVNQPAEVRKLTWEVDNSTGLLEPGFYDGSEIRFTTPRKCLTIPKVATFDNRNDKVYVVENGVLKIREITVGVTDGVYLEIVSGLNEGDIVITSSSAGLTEGIEVEVIFDEEAN